MQHCTTTMPDSKVTYLALTRRVRGARASGDAYLHRRNAAASAAAAQPTRDASQAHTESSFTMASRSEAALSNLVPFRPR